MRTKWSESHPKWDTLHSLRSVGMTIPVIPTEMKQIPKGENKFAILRVYYDK